MFKLIKSLFSFIFVILIILGILFFFRNPITKYAIEQVAAKTTGIILDIKDVNLAINDTFVAINDLRIFNKGQFQDRVMFHAPEIYVNYNAEQILKGKLHFQEIRLNFNEFMIVRNKKGEWNIDSLTKGLKGKESEAKKTPSSSKAPDIQIDHLLLKIGKVTYKDYTKGEKPEVKEFEVNIYEKIDNVTNLRSLLAFVVQKALMKTTLSNLANMDFDVLKDMARDFSSDKTVDAAKKKIQGLTDKINVSF